MLTLWGRKRSFCDGVTRRDFLRVGALGLGGLTLPDIFRLRAETAAAAPARSKAVIMVYLVGGPSHLDTYDLKPDAPAEFRGEFKPIRTSVPAMPLCELFPEQAKIADKLAVIQGLKATSDDHTGTEIMTGFSRFFGRKRRPAFGSVVSRLRGNSSSDLPPYVSLVTEYNQDEPPWEAEDPVYLGVRHRPFTLNGPGLANLSLPAGMTLNRMADRKTLLSSFDQLRRDIEAKRGQVSNLDDYQARALELVGSGKIREAFDLGREPDRNKARYGNDSLLLARRLVEAGVPVVTATIGVWDMHKTIFPALRQRLPVLDRAVAALVADLHERGLDRDVAVVVWGEFGRNPRINPAAGRDHWASGSILLAGGSMRMGQVVGETDARGARAKGKPYTPQNVLATLYHLLGIDPNLTLGDYDGRPVPILDDGAKIAELL